ncbi:hypothetical protein F5883DRAFT_576573 [Diaporthe sp. PMI_573]|nr:hypothetical protein F5883DRAFT_576573 [Diaporthaceae sp. PMI_573]
MSVPDFTEFTVWIPDYIYSQSPKFKDSCDFSPIFSTNVFDSGGHWFSLFPDQNPVAVASAAPAQKVDDSEGKIPLSWVQGTTRSAIAERQVGPGTGHPMSNMLPMWTSSYCIATI